MGTTTSKKKKYQSKDDSVLEQRSNLDKFTCDGLDSSSDNEEEQSKDKSDKDKQVKKALSKDSIPSKKEISIKEAIEGSIKPKEPEMIKKDSNPIVYEDINDCQIYYKDKQEEFFKKDNNCNINNLININDPFPFEEPQRSNSNKEMQNKQDSELNRNNNNNILSQSVLNQQNPEAFFAKQIKPQSIKVSPPRVIKKETYVKVNEEDLHQILGCIKKCEAKYQSGLKAVLDKDYSLAVGIFTKTKDSIITLSNIIKSKTSLPKDFSHSIMTKLIEKLALVNASLTTYMPYALKQNINSKKQMTRDNNTNNTNAKSQSNIVDRNRPRNKSNPKPSSTNKKPVDDEAKEAFEDKIEGEIVIKDTGIKFSDIVGMNDLKQILREIVFLPLERPELFTGLRQPLRGLLLFGPPGTGKTMIAKAMASECKSTFFNISASSLTSKWVGESEKTVRALFQLAYKKTPAIIFIDEIESILSKRSDNDNEAAKRLKTEFLVQFDGLSSSTNSKLLVVAATNRPLDLDDALLRRLPKKIYCGPLDMEGRVHFIHTVMKSVDNKLSEADLKVIAKQTNNYSNSDLKELCREASYEPVRELNTEQILSAKKLRDIDLKDFSKALTKIRGTITEAMLDELKKWNSQFGALAI